MGLIANELRLPLVPIEPATEKAVLEAARASRASRWPGRRPAHDPGRARGGRRAHGTRRSEAAAAGAADLAIHARVDLRENFPVGVGVWSDDVLGVTGAGDVIVDFSGPTGARAAAAAAAPLAARRWCPARPGFRRAKTKRRCARRRKRVAVLRASNFSLGIAALRVALRAALAAVPASWDVEIIERHHRLKKDSPSGTALTLATDVRDARDRCPRPR